MWRGFFEYKWIGMLMVVISVLFSWYLLDDLRDHLSWAWGNIGQLAPANISTDMGVFTNVIDDKSKHTMFSGGTKYLLLILLEVIIFYFCVKTLSILTKEKSNPTFKQFYKAEIRMIKLMGWNFGKGVAAQVMISMALSLLGFKELTATAMFFVYAYFIGYAFLDNYNEQFSFKLKQSQTIIRQHLGAAFMLGLVVTLLLYIPLVGPLLAPVFGGIAASIYGFRYSLETTEIENIKAA